MADSRVFYGKLTISSVQRFVDSFLRFSCSTAFCICYFFAVFTRLVIPVGFVTCRLQKGNNSKEETLLCVTCFYVVSKKP